ncbi:MAG: sigma-54-dependent Fis family transcriptional regulator [Myxococcales bacterium]|nr:sigma-54-dependent Fis family transcriptional regulator [Myxococcales bacterium]
MADRLLLVEDRDNLRNILAKMLSVRFDVDAVGDGATAIERLHEDRYAVVVTDVRLPGADGMEVLAAARALEAPPEVVLMTAYAGVPAAVAALRAGAYDYLSKPVEPDDLVRIASRAADRYALVRRTHELQALVEAGESGFIGRSAAAVEVRRRIERAGRLPAPVVLVGEPGSGKEIAAREIHRVRNDGPFVALSCGGVSETWLDAELFGRTGLLGDPHADGAGTLFLDDVGDLPSTLQAKLMRALGDEDRAPGNGRRPRVIAATPRDLERLVNEGGFRRDLGFWLDVVGIRLPPLRERADDIALLTARFLHLAGVRFGTTARRLAPDALATLEGGSWPGNVRELRHAIEQAAAAADGEVIEVEHLPESLRGGAPVAPAGTYRAAVERAADAGGRDYLVQVLRSANGNVTRAAVEAGVERETLHRLLKKHGVDPARFRP